MDWKKIIIPIVLFIGIGTVALVLNNKLSNRNRELEQMEQNYKAAKDTLHIYELKNGELLASQAGFVLNEKQMLEELEMTKAELKEIQKKVGQVKTITKIETRIKTDTIYMKSEVETQGDTIIAPFQHFDEWVALTGHTTIFNNHSTTQLNGISMSVPLTVGQTENNNYFVKSPNPYVSFTSITGVSKPEPKKKRWGLGLNLGPGVFYDARHNDISYGIGLQIGINYNF